MPAVRQCRAPPAPPLQPFLEVRTMPPVGQQGSRGALITWSVVCSILFVTATIFAIYFGVTASEVTQKAEQQRRNYENVIAQADLTSQKVNELQSFRSSEQAGPMGVNAQMPALDVALAQRSALAQTLAGNPSPVAAMQTVNDVITRAGTELKGANIALAPNTNLAQAVRTLTDALKARLQELEATRKQLADTKTQLATVEQQTQAQLVEMNKTIDQIRAEQAQTAGSVNEYQKSKDADIATIQAAVDQERQAAGIALQQRDVQLQEATAQIERLQKDLDITRQRFEGQRIDTIAPVTRQGDGTIVRVPEKGIVFISLGQADSVTPGLTFEVYDKQDGIPPAGDPRTEENLPKGKASIEVIRVGATSSEARVTRQDTGAILQEGDLIANLVYDRNTKYNFLVYGDFDLDQNGNATPGDADVVKRLITQWGGKLVDKAGVDTDFVVLGKEPIVPTFTDEELQDPFNQKRLDDAQKALEAYNQVLDTAIQMRVPVLNQNRFLYLIGYYNQAQR
jgi:hypothetical protein